MTTTKFNLLIIAGTALLVANVVEAKPTYLECFTVFKADPKFEFTVTLDEDTGRISHISSLGAFSTDGIFSANEISYQRTVGSAKYIINRSTLEVTKHTLVGIEPSVGSCSIIEVSDRKI